VSAEPVLAKRSKIRRTVAASRSGSLMGGRGSIMGALLAAIVLGMSYTGLILSGVSTTWFQSFRRLPAAARRDHQPAGPRPSAPGSA
jgi:hypothetical protein